MSANQSPINLSQSSSKPCNLSCSFSFDDITPPSGTVVLSDEGMIMLGNFGSCKFREQTYSCDAILVNHPSHHTLEGVQADGEVIALFRTPTGEHLMVSSLFHVNPNDTPSSNFFKQFIPYAVTGGPSNVSLNGWSLSQMGTGGYYVYSGSSVVPPCIPCEWVVFKTMINIDPTDFAFLVRNVQAGSRNIQGIGNRDVFYNEQSAGGPMPHDNKTYLVLRPLKGNNMKKPKPVKAVDLKTGESKLLKDKTDSDKESVTHRIKKHVSENPWEAIAFILLGLATFAGLYYGYTYGVKNHYSLVIWAMNFAKRLRGVQSQPLPSESS
jgi:carbonic anhydrase